MAKSIKKTSFCSLSRGMVKDDMTTYLKLVEDPHFICKNCLRVANKKQNLCKPKKIKK